MLYSEIHTDDEVIFIGTDKQLNQVGISDAENIQDIRESIWVIDTDDEDIDSATTEVHVIANDQHDSWSLPIAGLIINKPEPLIDTGIEPMLTEQWLLSMYNKGVSHENIIT